MNFIANKYKMITPQAENLILHEKFICFKKLIIINGMLKDIFMTHIYKIWIHLFIYEHMK
jgi:hypothetical protein